MEYGKFGQWLLDFSNTEVGKIISMVVGITISVLLILAYIFSRTSIGRKALLELRSKATTTKALVDTHKENTEKEFADYKEQVEQKLALYEEMFNEFKKETFEVLKLVPNAKVKKFVKDHENIDLKELVKERVKHSQNG